MVTSIWVILLMIKPKEKAFIYTWIIQNIKVSGKMICNMEMEWKYGQMDQNIKENILKVKK